MTPLQINRRTAQALFFLAFMMAPVLDIFRLDLYLGHFIILGENWTLGLDSFQLGDMSAGEAALQILVRVFIPIFIILALIIGSAWKYGRLYCGWLCPHFSVVEMINNLMFRASGKPSIWEKNPLPEKQADNRLITPNRLHWISVYITVLFFSFLWAVTFLTYLLPPKVIYTNLFTAELTRNQSIFLLVTTALLTIEFTFARHLFCRFACAVGVFQSLAWMGNKKAMVIGYNEQHARECQDCNSACDNICPMRLKPRTVKRKMFTCTTCGQCISACQTSQHTRERERLLKWVSDECALPVSDRGFGKYPKVPEHCFEIKTETSESNDRHSKQVTHPL